MKAIGRQEFISDYRGGYDVRVHEEFVSGRGRMHTFVARQFKYFLTAEHVDWAAMAHVSLTNEAGVMQPHPFTDWVWEGVMAPGAKQHGLLWRWKRYRLRRFLASGGILVVVGATRTGKTYLMEQVTPGKVIPFRFGVGVPCPGRIGVEDMPPGAFTVDEVGHRDRSDVLKAVNRNAANGDGVALIFGSRESFIRSNIGPYMANKKVHILELVRKDELPLLLVKRWV